MPDDLLIETRDQSLLLTLNRPEHRNALTEPLIDALSTAIVDAGQGPDIRCIVITGNGQAFCAGLDLATAQSAGRQPESGSSAISALYELLEQITHCTKPVIAAVNGFAVAGGAALMSACDIVIAADLARVGYPEIKRGLVAGIVMPYLLRQVGERRARYLLITGEVVDAAEAKKLGLVNEVVRGADVLFRSMHLAREIAELPEETVRLTKEWTIEARHLDPGAQREFCHKLYAQPRSHPHRGTK